MRINVALADSHPAVLDGVKAMLSKFDQFTIIGTARDYAEVQALLNRTHCDVLITDHLLSAGELCDGMSFLALIREQFPALQIVLFTISDHPVIRRSAMQIGIRFIVDKSATADVIINAVRMASHCNPPEVADASVNDANCVDLSAFRSLFPILTDRELEILRLYASGFTVTEISRKIHRTKQTISTQKRSCMRKLGITRDVELFRLIYECKLSSVENPKIQAEPEVVNPIV